MVLEWSFPFFLVICLACVCLIVAMSYLLKTMKGTQRKVTVLLSVGMIMLTAEGFFIYYIFQSRGSTQQIPASQQTQSSLEPLVKEVHDLMSVQQSLQKEALVLRQLLEQQQDEQDRLNDALKKLSEDVDVPKIKEEILNLIEQNKQHQPLPPLDLNIDGADQGQEQTEEGEEEEEEAVEETTEKTPAEKNYDSWFDSVAGKLKDIANEEKDRREKKWKNSQFKYLEKGQSAKLVTTTDPRYVIPQVEPSRLEAKQTVCNRVLYLPFSGRSLYPRSRKRSRLTVASA